MSAPSEEPKVEQQQSPAPEANGADTGNVLNGNEAGNEKPSHAAIDVPNGMNLTVEELYDKEKFDLSTMEQGDVYQILQTSPEGLTSQEAQARIEKFGPNKLEHKEQNPFLQFLGFMWNPLSWVMEAAAIVAIALSNGPMNGVSQPPDWEDFIGIILLLLANATIGFWEERQAGNAVQALMESLAPEAKVKRDGEWKSVDSAELVPGDVVSMKLGDIVPADARLITAHGQVSIDEAALTGESLPVTKEAGDEIFSGSTVKQGEAEAVVIGTGINTFFGRAAKLVGSSSDEMGHLQSILAKIGNFCMVTIGIFLVLEIIILYGAPSFRYEYRRGINNFLVLLIGGIPIAMPTVLSVTLAIGAKQLAEHKAIVTRITAIEEMAAVTILCSDKTGTLTLNKLVVDKPTIKQYAEFNGDDIILLSTYASRTQNMDAIDTCIVNSLPDPKMAREGVEELHFEPFNPVIKRTEMTYKRQSDGKVLRVAKGMSHTILDLCTRDKDEAQIKALNDDVDEYARRGLRALAVAVDEVPDGTVDGKGLGWRLVGLLPIYDPPREDTKETIDRAQALGVQVKMITGDQLAIAKETGRRLGMGDNMFLSKCLKDGPPPESGYKDLDHMVLEADGFAGVYPEHKYEIVERLQKMGHMTAMTGDGVNDAPALSKANVGIAVADASDAARSAADIVLTEPGLSVIIEAITGSRQIFQRMRNYSIYTCSVTIRVVVGFAMLAFAYKFDFPPFLVLILAILNDGTIMTISTDRVRPSPYPDQWNLKEIFSYAIVYGLYLALSTIVFFIVIYDTTFFQRTFGIPYFSLDGVSQVNNNPNDYRLHAVVYLQVSTISQGLIFITRSQGFFFMERPSTYLMAAFIVAQLVATFIAVYANWGFTDIMGCGWPMAGIAWIWNFIWFVPLDGIKFAMQRIFKPTKVVVADRLQQTEGAASRRSSVVSTSGRLYANRTRSLEVRRPSTFGRKIASGDRKFSMEPNEMRRFSSIQANHAGQVLRGTSAGASGSASAAGTVFALIGAIVVLPYLALVLYGAYGCEEQNLKKKYNAEWALVTGGSSGIGAAIVRKFARQQINVVIVALDDATLASFKTSIVKDFPQVQFRFIGCNLAKPDFLPQVIEQTKDIRISIVCNNAGFIAPGILPDMPFERVMANYNVNATAAVILTHHFSKRMVEEGIKGLITFTSSSAGFIPNPAAALYASTKAFLTTFAASLAAELKEDGIDILVIHPSPIDSNFYSNAGKMSVLHLSHKFSSPPSVIADTIARNAGKVVVADQGITTVMMKIAMTKILDWNVFTEIMKLVIGLNGDYRAIKADRKLQTKSK